MRRDFSAECAAGVLIGVGIGIAIANISTDFELTARIGRLGSVTASLIPIMTGILLLRKPWRMLRTLSITTGKLEAEHEQARVESNLPEKSHFRRRLYNNKTQTLILELIPHAGTLRVARLYARRAEDASYRCIGQPADDISYEHAYTSDSNSLLAFVSIRKSKDCQGGIGGYFEAVHTVDLTTWTVQEIVKKGGLVLPPPYNEAWVSDVLGIWPDGNGIDCILGLQKPEGGRVDYSLVRLEFSTRNVEIVSKLNGPFF